MINAKVKRDRERRMGAPGGCWVLELSPLRHLTCLFRIRTIRELYCASIFGHNKTGGNIAAGSCPLIRVPLLGIMATGGQDPHAYRWLHILIHYLKSKNSENSEYSVWSVQGSVVLLLETILINLLACSENANQPLQQSHLRAS